MKSYFNTLLRVALALAAYYLSLALLNVVFAAIGGAGVEGDVQGAMEAFLVEQSSLISIIHDLLITAAMLLLCLKWQSVRDCIPVTILPSREYLWCGLLSAAFSALVVLLLTYLPLPAEAVDSYDQLFTQNSGSGFLAHFLAVAVFAPLAEELLFRGLIYGLLQRSLSRRAALLVSCALFGLMHTQIIWITYAFLMGIVITLVYDHYRSLLAAVLFHAVFNIVGTFVIPSISGISAALLLVFAAIGLWLPLRHMCPKKTLS